MADGEKEGLGCNDQTSMWNRIEAGTEFPLSAVIALTERCNLSCGHCYLPRTPVEDEMSTVEVIDLLEQLAETGALKVTFTGGEPAMRGDLLPIIRAAVGLHFAVQLKTNGTLLDAGSVEALWEAGLTELNVSLYTDASADHDNFVGMSGAWEKTAASLDRFRSLGGLSRVSIVGMAWNASRLGPLVDLCVSRGWLYVVDVKMSRTEDGDESPLRYMATDVDLDIILDDHRLVSGALEGKGDDSPICLAGRMGPYIRPNGDIWPCPSLPVLFGNLRADPYKTIWRESPAREKLLGLTWGDSSMCSGCESRATCERCPGEAFWEHGDISQPTVIDCSLARARGRVVSKKK